jgi:glycosyltransferase involved in cell wall biosynthesis
MSGPDLSITIPFYNEEGCCEQVLQKLTAALEQHTIVYEIMAVDNGSTDQTGHILNRIAQSNPNVHIVKIARNEGYGWGIISGLNACTGKYIGYIDGDTQIAPDEVIRVYQSVLANQADIGKGKRIERFDGLQREIISKIYNILFCFIFSCPIHDINAKPKILRRTLYKQLGLKSKDWFIDAELVLKAHAAGMRIDEVEIEFLKRQDGTSKVRMATIWEFIKNLWEYRFHGPL